MALTLVILAVAVVTASAHHPLSRGNWLHHTKSAGEPIWLWNPSEESTFQAKNNIPYFVGAPSPAQAVHVFDERTGEVFSPVSADFTSSAQPGGVKIISPAGDLYRAAQAEDEASLNAKLNRPTALFTLAPRSSGFSNAPSSLSFAPSSTAFLVNPQPAGAHLIRTAYPANTAAFTQMPAGSTIIPLTMSSVQNLGRSSPTFVTSQSPLNSVRNTPTLVAIPSSRAAGHDEFSNSPTESAERWADMSCPIGFICIADPATHANLRAEATAKYINAQNPNVVVWDATPATRSPFSQAPAAKLIQVSAPEYAPFSVVQTPSASPLAFSSAIVKPLA